MSPETTQATFVLPAHSTPLNQSSQIPPITLPDLLIDKNPNVLSVCESSHSLNTPSLNISLDDSPVSPKTSSKKQLQSPLLPSVAIPKQLSSPDIDPFVSFCSSCETQFDSTDCSDKLYCSSACRRRDSVISYQSSPTTSYSSILSSSSFDSFPRRQSLFPSFQHTPAYTQCAHPAEAYSSFPNQRSSTNSPLSPQDNYIGIYPRKKSIVATMPFFPPAVAHPHLDQHAGRFSKAKNKAQNKLLPTESVLPKVCPTTSLAVSYPLRWSQRPEQSLDFSCMSTDGQARAALIKALRGR